ncbi:hypothetical protein [Actinocorallia lasiicapitis]
MGESESSYEDLREVFASIDGEPSAEEFAPHREDRALEDLAALSERHDPFTAARIAFGDM